MRILIVTDAWEPQINGVVRTYQNITRELRAMGHHVEVIGPGHFISFPMPGYKEIHLSILPYRKLSRMIGDSKADIVHIAVEGPLGWAARRYCTRNKIPFSTTYHTHFPDYVVSRAPFLGSRGKKILHGVAVHYVRRFHAPAKHTFVATQSLENQLKEWKFKAPMKRLLRGIDSSVFYTGPKNLYADKPKPIQLYVGRISVEKNIEAFLNLALPGTKVLVGDGPALELLRQKYPNVIFAGVQTGKALGDHYRSADVFVFPSKSDTFGMVLIEALACGLPLAGYNVTGPRDIVTDAQLGYVHDDLATAVQGALDSPGTAAERSAYTTATYSWRAVAETFATS